MSPNSRRSVIHRQFLNCCLLLGLLLAGIAGLTALTGNASAVLVAPSYSKADKTFKSPADTELAAKARLREGYGKLPLSFESNQGQTDRAVKFLSRGNGNSLFPTPTPPVLRLGIGHCRPRHRSNERSLPR